MLLLAHRQEPPHTLRSPFCRKGYGPRDSLTVPATVEEYLIIRNLRQESYEPCAFVPDHGDRTVPRGQLTTEQRGKLPRLRAIEDTLELTRSLWACSGDEDLPRYDLSIAPHHRQ